MDKNAKNLGRLVQALRKLETAKDGNCIVCGAKTYRDACVLLGPGFWIAPAGFHEHDCELAKVMREVQQEVIPEEKEEERKAFADAFKKLRAKKGSFYETGEE